MSRARGVVFTVNEWDELDETSVAMCGAQYCVYGIKVDECGRANTEGYLYFKNPRRISGLKKRMPKAHFEVRRRSHEETRDHCIRNADVVEVGEPPQKNGGDKMSDRLEKSKRLRDQTIEESVARGDISFLQIKKLKECKEERAQRLASHKE